MCHTVNSPASNFLIENIYCNINLWTGDGDEVVWSCENAYGSGACLQEADSTDDLETYYLTKNYSHSDTVCIFFLNPFKGMCCNLRAEVNIPQLSTYVGLTPPLPCQTILPARLLPRDLLPSHPCRQASTPARLRSPASWIWMDLVACKGGAIYVGGWECYGTTDLNCMFHVEGIIVPNDNIYYYYILCCELHSKLLTTSLEISSYNCK